MPERVLLTGGSGFFGRRIAEALRRHGYDVSTPGRPEFDMLDASLTRRTIERLRPDTIVHSAAYYGGLGICMAEPTQIFHRNVLMGVNLFEAAAKAGVRKIMAIGSACSYPGGVAGDMKEDDFWSGPLHPSVESYGFTKKVLEVGLRAYGKGYGIVGQMPIVTNLYGEYDVFGEYRSHVAAALIKKFADAVQSKADKVVCWGTGAPMREFIYSGDAAEAVARLLQERIHRAPEHRHGDRHVDQGTGRAGRAPHGLPRRDRLGYLQGRRRAPQGARRLEDGERPRLEAADEPRSRTQANHRLVPREQGRGRRATLSFQPESRGKLRSIERGIAQAPWP